MTNSQYYSIINKLFKKKKKDFFWFVVSLNIVEEFNLTELFHLYVEFYASVTRDSSFIYLNKISLNLEQTFFFFQISPHIPHTKKFLLVCSSTWLQFN